MNITMSREVFETVIALYIIEIAKRAEENETVTQNTDIFNKLLEHINSLAMGSLITSYNEADAETKLYYRRFINDIIEKGYIKIMI
jgi:hypothetical protein